MLSFEAQAVTCKDGMDVTMAIFMLRSLGLA